MEFNTIHIDTVSSTNDEAMSQDWPHASVIVAEHQTAGRGQRGNIWLSETGVNLTFSLVLHPDELCVCDSFEISKMAALAVTDALGKLGIEAKIKWPNDIYVGDSKICGILIENRLMGPWVNRSVVGIGINVNQQEFDPSLPNPTSILKITGKAVDRPIVLSKFCEAFAKRFAQEYSDLDAEYIDKLYRQKGIHRFSKNGEIFMASILAIGPTGDLVLKTEAGEIEQFAFKEVEFII